MAQPTPPKSLLNDPFGTKKGRPELRTNSTPSANICLIKILFIISFKIFKKSAASWENGVARVLPFRRPGGGHSIKPANQTLRDWLISACPVGTESDQVIF